MPTMTLQEQIEQMAAEFSGTAGLAARNLTTGEEIRVNADLSFPTASMIKIVILYELVRQCARGQAQLWERMTLRKTDKTLGSGLLVDFDEGANLTLRDLAVMMMAISDNTATNLLIDRLGKHAVNEAAREAGMARTELRNKIDFDQIRQSNDNLAVSVPQDFCDFLTALHRGELIPPPFVEQMLGIMRIQKYIEPLRKHLPFDPYAFEFGKPQEIWIASKTGGLQGVRTEAGLIHTERADWAICVMTKDFGDAVSAADNKGSAFISQASKTLFDAWS